MEAITKIARVIPDPVASIGLGISTALGMVIPPMLFVPMIAAAYIYWKNPYKLAEDPKGDKSFIYTAMNAALVAATPLFIFGAISMSFFKMRGILGILLTSLFWIGAAITAFFTYYEVRKRQQQGKSWKWLPITYGVSMTMILTGWFFFELMNLFGQPA